jgi:hypothetical protein
MDVYDLLMERKPVMKKYRLRLYPLLISSFLFTACTNNNASTFTADVNKPNANLSIITSADAISVNKLPLASNDKLCEQLNTIFRSSIESNYVKTQAATGIINRYDLTQTKSVMQCFSEAADDYPGYHIKSVLMNRYAFLDPAEAMRTLEDLNFSVRMTRDSLEYTVFTHWVSKSPMQAFLWLNNSGYGNRRYGFVQLVFSALAKDDYADALTLVDSLPDRELVKYQAISGIMRQATTNEQFLSLLNKIDNGEEFYPPLEAWFHKDQQAVFQYIDSLEGQRKINAIKSVFDTYVKLEPNTAANWYVTVFEPSKRDIEYVISQIRFNNLKDALSWILQRPESTRQAELAELLSFEALAEPRFVAKHLHLIESEDMRLRISKTIYSALLGISVKQANAFADGSEFSDEIERRY